MILPRKKSKNKCVFTNHSARAEFNRCKFSFPSLRLVVIRKLKSPVCSCQERKWKCSENENENKNKCLQQGKKIKKVVNKNKRLKETKKKKKKTELSVFIFKVRNKVVDK